MPAPRSNPFRRASGWLATAALLALAPKCLLCVIAYAGVVSTLGFAGPELCGASAAPAVTWATSLVLSVVGLGTAVFVENRRHR